RQGVGHGRSIARRADRWQAANTGDERRAACYREAVGCNLRGWCAVVVLASVAAGHDAPARADEPRAEEAGGRWQGTSWGFELRSGFSFRARDEAITPAPILGVGFRVCTLLQLVDAELFAQTM